MKVWVKRLSTWLVLCFVAASAGPGFTQPSNRAAARHSAIQPSVELDGKAVMHALNAQGTYEIFFTDGTPSNTVRLKQNDQPRGFQWAYPLPGHVAIFTDAADGSNKWYVQFVDSTGVIGPNVNPVSFSDSSAVAVFGSKIYWLAIDPTNFSEYLFSSDGAATGKILVPGSDNSDASQRTFSAYAPFKFNGHIYIQTQRCLDCFDDTKEHTTMTVWRLDHRGFVEAFTYRFHYEGETPLCPTNPAALSPTQLLFINWSQKTGCELWVTDGTSPGSHLIKTLNPGKADGALYIPDGWRNLIVGGKQLFVGKDPINGIQLWGTDGTEEGTTRLSSLSGLHLTDAAPLLLNMVVHRDVGYTESSTAKIYQTDGTRAGTKATPIPLVADTFAIAGDWLYFVDQATRSGLQRFNTRTKNIEFVKSVAAYFLTAVGNTVIFTGSSNLGDPDLQPWISDGTAAGTKLIKRVVPGGNNLNPIAYTPLVGP